MSTSTNILFWSGGKDAFLAYHYFTETHGTDNLCLLTTFNEQTGRVPHQDIAMRDIKQQATHLNLPLLKVPLPPDCPNDEYLRLLKQALNDQSPPVNTLIWGDVHLQDIRSWRERQFGNEYRCLFPIWQKSMHELLPILLLRGVEVRISAVQPEWRDSIAVGELYNQSFVRQLPRTIDPLGENGEFHTQLRFLEPASTHL